MEELKDDIHNKLEVLKEHTSDEEYIKKINQLSDELHKINEFKDTRKERKAIKKLNKKVTFYERFLEGLERDLDIDPSRLMGLTDGIFGMVMTLLVFGIALPELQIDSKNFLEKNRLKRKKDM